MPPPAATTRSPDAGSCETPLYIALKHPSRWRSDPGRFVFGCWVLGVGRVLGVGWPAVGCWVGVGCWVLQGGDDEVSRADALQGVSGRSLQAPLTLASRSVGDHPLGVGCWMPVGCWVRGRVAPGGSSRRRGHFAGIAMAGLKAPVDGITLVSS